MNNGKIAVIVINWNGKALLEECISSVLKQDYYNYQVIFVDNGSSDGSGSFVKNNFPSVDVIELKENTGFARANNVGIERAFEDPETEYVALLNNDAMVEERWLSEMLKVIKMDDRTGSVAPKILKYHKREVIDGIGHKIHADGTGVNYEMNEIDHGQYNKVFEIFGASGCSCLFRRSMLQDIKHKNDYFDSDFFLYLEDLDLNWRARLRGWNCYFAPGSSVYHKHSETNKLYSPFKAFFVNRNRFFVILKNYPLFMLPKAFYYIFYRYFDSLMSIKKDKGSSARLFEKAGALQIVAIVLKGWLDAMRHFPKMILKRSFIQKNRTVSDEEIKRLFREFSSDLREVTYKEHIV